MHQVKKSSAPSSSIKWENPVLHAQASSEKIWCSQLCTNQELKHQVSKSAPKFTICALPPKVRFLMKPSGEVYYAFCPLGAYFALSEQQAFVVWELQSLIESYELEIWRNLWSVLNRSKISKAKPPHLRSGELPLRMISLMYCNTCPPRFLPIILVLVFSHNREHPSNSPHVTVAIVDLPVSHLNIFINCGSTCLTF